MPRPLLYSIDERIAHFRLVASHREACAAAGISDNAGAIHCAERVLDELCRFLVYPGLSHNNNLRDYPGAVFSVDAWIAHNEGRPVEIEHVAPQRDFTRAAIAFIADSTNEEFKQFIFENYQLVLLTITERARLDRINRLRMAPDRLQSAGIVLRSLEADRIES